MKIEQSHYILAFYGVRSALRWRTDVRFGRAASPRSRAREAKTVLSSNLLKISNSVFSAFRGARIPPPEVSPPG